MGLDLEAARGRLPGNAEVAILSSFLAAGLAWLSEWRQHLILGPVITVIGLVGLLNIRRERQRLRYDLPALLPIVALVLPTAIAYDLYERINPDHSRMYVAIVLLAATWLGIAALCFLQAKATNRIIADPHRYPWDVFTVQEVEADLSSSPNISHKDKVRLILTNATGKELNIWTPVWESEEVHAQYPFGSKLHFFGSNDWKVKGNWDDGHPCITLQPGQSFMCWIGLMEPHGEGIRERIKHRNTGTAVFPVKIEGKLYDVPIKL